MRVLLSIMRSPLARLQKNDDWKGLSVSESNCNKWFLFSDLKNVMIVMFWIKLNHSLSFQQIGSMFYLDGDAEIHHKRTSAALGNVLLCLIHEFVPFHLGFSQIMRAEAVKQNNSFSMEFFSNSVNVMWDSTYNYIYIGKISQTQTIA